MADLSDHNCKLIDILQILRNNNLKIQTEKCNFLRKEIQFLGHIITTEGIKPNPKTVEAVKNFPTPRTQKQVKSFIGLTSYYRKFIPGFSSIAEPLHKLTRKRNEFIWDDSCEMAFNALKHELSNPPILQYPDMEKPFILTTDASCYGLGAVLSQNHNGHDLPIAFASRTLNNAEKNYSTIEKEMLATKWAVSIFRPDLYGQKFTLVTVHKPLTSALCNASKNGS